MTRSAEAGYAWAQSIVSFHADSNAEQLAWLEKSASQGERDAIAMLSEALSSSSNESRSSALLREAAFLGHPDAQMQWALRLRVGGSPEAFAWMRRSAIQRPAGVFLSFNDALSFLLQCVQRELAWWDRPEEQRKLEWLIDTEAQQGVNREEMDEWVRQNVRKKRAECRIALNEIGLALDSICGWKNVAPDERVFVPGSRAVALAREWRKNASQAVLCWIWLSRQLGLIRDIRILIADIIWEERNAWIL